MAGADEIYERYLNRAIREINALHDEIGSCSLIDHPVHAPVLGSGHPLGDVMLLKYRPQPSEIEEGVAFYGRAGQAVLKSLRRLGIDPTLVYGTNCVKCDDGEPDQAASACPAWLLRELAIVQPKLVVCMGEETLDALNDLGLSLAEPLDPARMGELQRLTPSIEAIVTPDIDASLDTEDAKRAFWQAFKALGDWWSALPPY